MSTCGRKALLAWVLNQCIMNVDDTKQFCATE